VVISALNTMAYLFSEGLEIKKEESERTSKK
jgi:hypothetical protein